MPDPTNDPGSLVHERDFPHRFSPSPADDGPSRRGESGKHSHRLALIDTHAHLCDHAFAADIDAVLERALRAGVHGVVIVSEGIDDAKRALELSRRRAARLPRLIPAVGLAPAGARLDLLGEVLDLARLERRAVGAIGEVGLDYWLAKTDRERDLQKEVFSALIDLAAELDVPLNVHSRSAGARTVELLLSKGAKKVQLHAFDAKVSAALPAAEAGYFFSIPPSVVRSEQKRKLVRTLPLRALLLETDSPVLGPSPHERNEPVNVLVSLRAVAEIKNVPVEEAAETVFRNTLALYGTPLSLRDGGP